MPAAVPKIIKNFNLLIDGFGYAGKVDEVTLPTLTIKSEDHRGGGQDMPIQIDMGMERLELKFSMAEHSPAIFAQFGLQDGKAVNLTFRGAQSDDKVVEPYVINARGSYRELTPSAFKAGDKTPLAGTISLRYYRLTINGVTLIEIDVDNMRRIINGVDVLAAQRAAIAI